MFLDIKDKYGVRSVNFDKVLPISQTGERINILFDHGVVLELFYETEEEARDKLIHIGYFTK